MKRILSIILALTILNVNTFNAFAFAPTNVNDPSCIKVQDLKAGNIITYTRKKDACGCKSCEVKLIPYDRLLLAVTQMRINLASDMKKIGDYIDYGKKSGDFATQSQNFIQIPAALLNLVLNNMGLTPISTALTVIVGVSAAGTVTGIALKHGYFYPRAIKTDRNIKMDQHSLKELSRLINQKYWQNNNFVLISKDKKDHDVVVNFENKLGLEYDKNINWNKEFEIIDAEIKLALLVNDEEAMNKLDNLFNNKKQEFEQDMLTAYKAICAATMATASTISAYKKEKIEIEQTNNNDVSDQVQINDPVTQTDTQETQANIDTNFNPLNISKNPSNSDKKTISKFEPRVSVNTSKKIDDRKINIQAKPHSNVTVHQFIYNSDMAAPAA